MERLTTNKNVLEMGMYELAHNCCYMAEDGTGRYRDFEMDMDARDFARNLMTTLLKEDLPLEDESFDEEMMDNLMIDPFADVRGLIALFYRNMWAMADLRERLKRYEDAEEQKIKNDGADMKENKVLELLKRSKRQNDMVGILPGSDIGNTIIKALEEVQQYRKLGTPEDLKTMKEHGAFTGVELANIAAMQSMLREYQQIGTPKECRMAMGDQVSRQEVNEKWSIYDVTGREYKGIEKKILPEYYNAVISGSKTFELRKDEDNIQAGDFIVLKEWDGKRYTGRQTWRRAKYVLRDVPEYGLCPGYCIVGC